MAKVIVIDPINKTVYRADLSFDQMRECIGCDLLEPVRCAKGTILWVDEEGMLKDQPTLWVLAGKRLIAGKAIFAGEGDDDEGFGDLAMPGETVASVVSWIPERMQALALRSVPMGGFFALGDEEQEAKVRKMFEDAEFTAEMLAIQGEGAEFRG
jgi:hypothetical protein